MRSLKTGAPRPPTLRSGITNNPYRLDGVDMRSSRGRRFRDIVDTLIAEFGVANADRLRDLAAHKLALEDLQSQVVAGGDHSAREDLVRQANLVARQETALRYAARHERRDSTPSLHEYLAANRDEAAA
jgi:hypothetical protein